MALTDHGIKVIEFNVRFGDPETQVLIPRLKSPLAQLLLKAATGKLAEVNLEWRDESAVTVVLAANGYPNNVQIGNEITNLNPVSDVKIFHAGTKLGENSNAIAQNTEDHSKKLLSSGGRVLTVTGLGRDLTEARDRAYRTISQIKLEGSFYRNDIALNASIAEMGN